VRRGKTKAQNFKVRREINRKDAARPVEEFLPYQEFLVGYLYEVKNVIAGEYPKNKSW